jgi:hypothetical protein
MITASQCAFTINLVSIECDGVDIMAFDISCGNRQVAADTCLAEYLLESFFVFLVKS